MLVPGLCLILRGGDGGRSGNGSADDDGADDDDGG